ncbi:MAG: TetR/AcrR family transcriptional regulator [Clostridia bacterium]|nr:TetR/AcrR family transcriptional regulator [Clostridia bacterium]
MARPKKPEERNRIRDVAFNVFASKGFENSSFSDIAKEAAVSKSLVQYYFPKKEQFISDFIDRSLSAVEQIVAEDLDVEYEHELGKLYAIGYAQFYFAMYNEKMNSLRMDIMRDRGNTEMVVKNGIDWILENTSAIPTDTPEKEELIKKTLVFVVGGAFDYLYDCMIYGVDFDTAFLSDVAMTLLNPYLEKPFSEGDKLRAVMTPEWLEKARKKYNRMLFTVK